MSKKLNNEQLKAMFVKLGGYDGIHKGKRGIFWSSGLSQEREVYMIGGNTEQQLQKMILDEFIKSLKKQNETVKIESDKHGTVYFTNSKEYDENEPELSRYYTTSLKIVGDNIDEEYNVKKHKNPLFPDNPQCPQCYKKKTTLYSTTNVQGKKVKVCSSCKENIKMAKEIDKNYKQ
tara:strand:- start:1808 stop:2335 length:528 start_codon:yes stop_codon:yes gene_type:complete